MEWIERWRLKIGHHTGTKYSPTTPSPLSNNTLDGDRRVNVQSFECLAAITQIETSADCADCADYVLIKAGPT